MSPSSDAGVNLYAIPAILVKIRPDYISTGDDQALMPLTECMQMERVIAECTSP
jgi:hypothetical protein